MLNDVFCTVTEKVSIPSHKNKYISLLSVVVLPLKLTSKSKTRFSSSNLVFINQIMT